MEQERKKGDRNVKENDKHLFLETILSAQKYFYISYIGRSSKDNTEQPPSVLVDELIDYIQSGIEDEKLLVKNVLITTHPLHGFSQKYDKQNPKLYSYLRDSETKKALTDINEKKTREELAFNEISIDSLIAFFKNPFKAYYNNVLGIRYDQDEVLLPENEVFELDSLQSWQLKQDLLFLDANSLSTYRNKKVATGSLPLRNMADRVLADTENAITTLRNLVAESRGDAEEEFLNIELNIGNSLIKGKIERIYNERIISISFSKNENKYLLEAYIKYLLAIAAQTPKELHFISAEKNKMYKISKHAVTRAQAFKTLQNLVNLYKEGHERILMFFPDLTRSPADAAGLNQEKFDVLLKKYFDGEFCDPYLMKERTFGFFKQEGIFEEYVQNCATIFSDEGGLFSEYYLRK
jgi:exodeoxyribonuclease V gamma subunit